MNIFFENYGMDINTQVSIISIIVTLLSITQPIIFAMIRYKKKKEIRCLVSSREVILGRQKLPSTLGLKIGDKSINRFIVTDVSFWNNTHTVITSEDISESSPFSVAISKGKVLNASVLKEENPLNQINIMLKEYNIINIIFSQLGYKEGGKLQIYHTGKENSITVSEVLNNGKIVTNFESTQLHTRRYTLIGTMIGFIIGVVLAMTKNEIMYFMRGNFLIVIILIVGIFMLSNYLFRKIYDVT